jgi:hypothetical protein
MSREWENYAWENAPAAMVPALVFRALAWYTNFEGIAFPSVATLSEVTRVNPRNVQRALLTLIKEGWIVALDRRGGRGKSASYQIIKRVTPETPFTPERVTPETPFTPERVTPETPFTPERVTNRPLKGDKNASLYRLSKREVKDLKTSTYGADEKPKNKVSPIVPHSAIPPDPLVNPEIRTWVDLIVCSSPGGVSRHLSTFDVTPSDRVAVLEAAKAETHKLGIDLPTALQGILQAVEAQVAESPPGELRFLGDVTTYFKKRNYRKNSEYLNGKGNGNGTFRSKAEQHEETLRKFLGRGGDSTGVGVVDLDADKPRRISATRLPKRVM